MKYKYYYFVAHIIDNGKSLTYHSGTYRAETCFRYADIIMQIAKQKGIDPNYISIVHVGEMAELDYEQYEDIFKYDERV